MAERDEPNREAALRLAILRHWYGDRLSAAQWGRGGPAAPH